MKTATSVCIGLTLAAAACAAHAMNKNDLVDQVPGRGDLSASGVSDPPMGTRPPATRRASPAGESWEYRGEMQMMGMKMPMPPAQVCHRTGETAVPPVDKRCQTQDVRASGSKTTFRVVCGPPDPMEGTGEMTRLGDRADALYRLKSRQGEMVMTMNGRRLGPCAALR